MPSCRVSRLLHILDVILHIVFQREEDEDEKEDKEKKAEERQQGKQLMGK